MIYFLLFDFVVTVSQDKLSKKFKVSGIPTLVFLDGETAKVNESDGRSVIMEDETGANFPWIPKSFEGMLWDSSVGQFCGTVL